MNPVRNSILFRDYPEMETSLPVMGGMQQTSSGREKILFLAFNTALLRSSKSDKTDLSVL
jgi:hypothetical protein